MQPRQRIYVTHTEHKTTHKKKTMKIKHTKIINMRDGGAQCYFSIFASHPVACIIVVVVVVVVSHKMRVWIAKGKQ